MRRRLLTLLALSATLLATPARAEDEDEQFWVQVNTNVPVTKRFRFTLEQIGRWGDRADGLLQTEVGVLSAYQIAKGVELALGYRRVGLYSSSAPSVFEDRIRQHVVVTRGAFVGRFRVDERFNPGGREVGFRVRPLIRYNHRVGDKGWALFASHESFFLPNDTRWGQRSGYERMRNWFGVTVPVMRKISADLGYLNQHRFARGGGASQTDHSFSVQVTLNPSGPILSD